MEEEEEQDVRSWWRWRWQAEGDGGWWRWHEGRRWRFLEEWENDGVWLWRWREESEPGDGEVGERDWMVQLVVEGPPEALGWRRRAVDGSWVWGDRAMEAERWALFDP